MVRKRVMATSFSILFVFGFFRLPFPQVSVAATHYVSPTGSARWEDSTDINTPCSIRTAFSSAVAGDTVYFRGGIYSSSSGDPGGDLAHVYTPSNAGSGDPDAQRIIFRAYPGEIPILEHTWTDSTIVHHLLGTKSYVTYDGFTLRATGGDSAGIHIGGDSNASHHVGVIVRNLTIIGGINKAPAVANNRDLIRFENADHCKIQYCKIGPFNTDGVTDNGSLIKIYHVVDATIENNELFNSSSIGISVKGYLTGATIRYNWFHNNAQSIRVNTYSGVTTTNLNIYHNVFYQTSNYQITNFNLESGGPNCTGWNFYNNTLYGTRETLNFADASGSITGFKVYNNIFYRTGTSYSNMFVPNTGTHTFAECDHNQWGGNTFRIYWKGTNYSNLASWQASTVLEGGLHPGVGDLASDILFVNGSGSLSQLNDFRLAPNSPCKGRGRNGTDMGANIDYVGPQGKPPGVNYPAPPTGLKIIQ